ncbi:MAG TPA: hypothetical protein VHZ33_27310 [Trebonia sp.]|nr:hypothetical protein [Trebonia sp.]
MTHATGRKIGAALAAVAIGTLAFGASASASVTSAASPGWRQVYSKHYGAANNYSAYNAVVATSKGNAWAFGGSNVAGGNDLPIAAHWNGRAWAASALPAGAAGEISAASAPAANDVWAVTFFDGYVLHWNGSRWTVAKHLLGGGELTGVTALSPTNVWVFGGSGFGPGLGTWHFNGKTWSQWHGDATGLQTGSALSATNIWALGGTQAPFSGIMHYTGTWRPVTASVLTGLQFRSIVALSATNVWVTAETGEGSQVVPYLLHFNGKWTRYKLPWAVFPAEDLASDGQGGLWLSALSSGGETYLVHRTAKGAWSRAPFVNPGKGVVGGLAQIPGTSSLWAAGLKTAKTNGSAVIWADGTV